MLVSAREAARILAEIGLSREQSRRVLHAGLAGPGTRTSGSILYDASRVRALLDWPHVDEGELADTCPGEVFVARFGPQRGLDLRRPRSDWLDAACCGWDLSMWTRVLLRHRARELGGVPFVGTVAGFVAFGAEIVGFTLDREPNERQPVERRPGERQPNERGSVERQGTRKGASSLLGGERALFRLELGDPGGWFESLRGRRFPTGQGGPWLLWRPGGRAVS